MNEPELRSFRLSRDDVAVILLALGAVGGYAIRTGEECLISADALQRVAERLGCDWSSDDGEDGA